MSNRLKMKCKICGRKIILGQTYSRIGENNFCDEGCASKY